MFPGRLDGRVTPVPDRTRHTAVPVRVAGRRDRRLDHLGVAVGVHGERDHHFRIVRLAVDQLGEIAGSTRRKSVSGVGSAIAAVTTCRTGSGAAGPCAAGSGAAAVAFGRGATAGFETSAAAISTVGSVACGMVATLPALDGGSAALAKAASPCGSTAAGAGATAVTALFCACLPLPSSLAAAGVAAVCASARPQANAPRLQKNQW